jgi:6-phosphofructokinase 1
MYRAEDLVIRQLGVPSVDSPLDTDFVPDDEAVSAVRLRSELGTLSLDSIPMFERAGPRRRIWFRPERTTCAIVTCGGLCPGLNDVIRGITQILERGYGVRRILGLQYGYQGLVPRSGIEPLELDYEKVSEIHRRGGSILKTSRGEQDPVEMADGLRRLGIDVLFTIGGEGTQRGAAALAAEARRLGLEVAIVGVPKTIDNDIPGVEKSFGFETAVGESVRAITAGHIEAHDFPNGVAIVRLMGRDSGFIAAAATVASGDVNFCLVPEVDFELEGPDGLLAALERRLHARKHAVIVVAEGAGVRIREKLGYKDIGFCLRDVIARELPPRGLPISMKYLDPSYMIRSVPASADDSVFCRHLAGSAVHAAMSGRTEMVVGYVSDYLVHLPMAIATGPRRTLDPHGTLWRAVLESTDQPKHLGTST